MLGNRGIVTYINSAFLNHVIERLRSKGKNQDIYDNPWRYVYRRVSSVLNESGKFIKYGPRGKGICFGLSDGEPCSIVLPEDLMGIEFPGDIPMNDEAITRKGNILKLAIHFWEKSALLTKDPYIRISIRSFISWMNKHVIMGSRVESFPVTGDSGDETARFNPLIHTADNPDPDIRRLSHIRKWVVNFLNQLKEDEKKIFYYYECRGLKGSEISARMSKKANLSYQRDKIRARLKEFLRPLEGLSPEPVRKKERADLDGFRYFTEKLCEQLEQKIIELKN